MCHFSLFNFSSEVGNLTGFSVTINVYIHIIGHIILSINFCKNNLLSRCTKSLFIPTATYSFHPPVAKDTAHKARYTTTCQVSIINDGQNISGSSLTANETYREHDAVVMKTCLDVKSGEFHTFYTKVCVQKKII